MIDESLKRYWTVAHRNRHGPKKKYWWDLLCNLAWVEENPKKRNLYLKLYEELKNEQPANSAA